MDIQTLMPLLMNILGGGNNNLFQSLSNQTGAPQKNLKEVPKEVLASYPQSYTQESKPNNFQSQSALQSQNQSNSSSFSLPNMDIIKNLMPMLQNANKQKSSPPRISELQSIDDYMFD